MRIISEPESISLPTLDRLHPHPLQPFNANEPLLKIAVAL